MLTMRACTPIAVLVLLLAQHTYALPPTAPESNRATETSRPKIAQKNEKGEAAQAKTDKLSASIDELSTAIRDSNTRISDEYEKEKMQVEGKALKAEEKIANETENLAIYTDRLASLTLLLVIVGVFQIGIFLWQLILLNKTAKDAGKSADAALETAKAVTLSERAYIKISHDQPGLIPTTSTGDALYSKNRTYELRLEVRNIGKTPAELTRLSFTSIILLSDESLPCTPSYGAAGEAIRATMYGTDAIFPRESFDISKEDGEAIWNGTKNLYILGAADYIDHFGIRHRAGYARRYDPHVTEGNLFMVTKRGYNYDEHRQPGDGHDWNDPA